MLFGKREQSCWVVLAVFVSGLVLVAEGNPARADGNRNQPRPDTAASSNWVTQVYRW